MNKTTRIVHLVDSTMGWNFKRLISIDSDGYDVVCVKGDWLDLDVLRDLVDGYLEEDTSNGQLLSMKNGLMWL